jgi:mannose-6-phosphate isomerase-like protein (cupin superfamily)
MIRQGDSIENQVTGERLVFIKTSAETNGELVVVEAFVKPSGFVASLHLHLYQDERFEVLAGEVGFQLGKSRLIARPGQCVSVPAGTPHKFWNASDNEEAHFVCSVKPALQFERLIETMFSLAHAHYDDVRLPFPPEWMQRMGLALGAPLGRLLGYKAIYVPLGAEAALGG